MPYLLRHVASKRFAQTEVLAPIEYTPMDRHGTESSSLRYVSYRKQGKGFVILC